MLDFRSRLTALSIAAALGLLLAVVPAASADQGVVTRSLGADAGQRALDYWTPERMSAATPLAMPQVDGDTSFSAPTGPTPRALPPSSRIDLSNTIQPTAPRGGGKVQIGDKPPYVAGEVPLDTQTNFPTSTNGRLFGELPGIGQYSCSATVVTSSSQSVIMTAGHCVFDAGAGFAKRVVFVPAYHQRDAPFGAFSASKLVATKGWQRVTNFNYDYAAIKLRKSRGRTVGETVGEQGVAFSQPREQNFQAIGYPFNKEKAELMWNCVAPFAGVDPRDRFAGKPDSGIGCDMSSGASGGGWFIHDTAGTQFLNSVTSFGYRAIKKVLFGPYFDRKVLKVLDQANR